MERIIEEVDFTLEVPAVNYKKTITLVVKEKETYLVLYGSGFLRPDSGSNHNTGDAFKKVAEARHKINQENNPQANCVMKYCPTDIEFFEIINSQTAIKRLDIYSHAWLQGLNLGGFKGTRTIGGVEYNSDTLDWKTDLGKGYDLRLVQMLKNELESLDNSVF